MKTAILCLVFPLSLLATGCGGAAENGEASHEHHAATAPVAHDLKDLDPVCAMVNDGTWTEYTVHNGDTVYFCSETCREAFEGNPQKYFKQ